MNAKSYALIAVFSALAIVFNTVRIPALYHPNFAYPLFNIPVLIAFILYGFKIGFLVEIIHILGQEIFFPTGPGGIVTYPMGLVIHAFMFFGIYTASKFIHRKIALGKKVGEKKKIFYYTGLSTILRGGLMPIIDYAVLTKLLLPLALGRTFPEDFIIALIPFVVLYNVTSTLYEVPIAYFIAKKTSNYMKINAKYLIDD